MRRPIPVPAKGTQAQGKLGGKPSTEVIPQPSPSKGGQRDPASTEASLGQRPHRSPTRTRGGPRGNSQSRTQARDRGNTTAQPDKTGDRGNPQREGCRVGSETQPGSELRGEEGPRGAAGGRGQGKCGGWSQGRKGGRNPSPAGSPCRFGTAHTEQEQAKKQGQGEVQG